MISQSDIDKEYISTYTRFRNKIITLCDMPWTSHTYCTKSWRSKHQEQCYQPYQPLTTPIVSYQVLFTYDALWDLYMQIAIKQSVNRFHDFPFWRRLCNSKLVVLNALTFSHTLKVWKALKHLFFVQSRTSYWCYCMFSHEKMIRYARE